MLHALIVENLRENVHQMDVKLAQLVDSAVVVFDSIAIRNVNLLSLVEQCRLVEKIEQCVEIAHRKHVIGKTIDGEFRIQIGRTLDIFESAAAYRDSDLACLSSIIQWQFGIERSPNSTSSYEATMDFCGENAASILWWRTAKSCLIFKFSFIKFVAQPHPAPIRRSAFWNCRVLKAAIVVAVGGFGSGVVALVASDPPADDNDVRDDAPSAEASQYGDVDVRRHVVDCVGSETSMGGVGNSEPTSIRSVVIFKKRESLRWAKTNESCKFLNTNAQYGNENNVINFALFGSNENLTRR
uniref:Uncharacterized protein n=1 Tax=Romanomermis culicivorax TaxID=13658 RepID=A0A915JYA7_ROMCU